VPEWEYLKMVLRRSRLWIYLIEMIMSKGSNRLKGAINVSGKHVLELKKIQ
jgi:hypothetical protein